MEQELSSVNYKSKKAVNFTEINFEDVNILTPNRLVLNNLSKILTEKNIDRKTKRYYLAVVENNPDQIRYMNMRLLADVLDFHSHYGNKNLKEENILPYLSDLLKSKENTKDLSKEEMRMIDLKLLASFYRYLRYFLTSEEYYRSLEETEETE